MAKVKTIDMSPTDIVELERKPGDIKRLPPSHDTTTHRGALAWFNAMMARSEEEGVFVVEEMLTTSLARILLERNPTNRTLSKGQINQLASAMRNGSFDGMNGELIRISVEGNLIDGQHRCTAKLQAERDVMTRFMFGLEPDARATIDQTRPRTAGDYLVMDGLISGKQAAAVGMALYLWRTHGHIKDQADFRIGRSEAAEYTKQNYTQIMNSMRMIPRKGIAQVGGLSMLTFAHVVFSEIDPEMATDFIDKLVHGYDLPAGSPILAVRNRMGLGNRLKRNERWELIMRGWNAYRDNRQVASLPILGRFPELK